MVTAVRRRERRLRRSHGLKLGYIFVLLVFSLPAHPRHDRAFLQRLGIARPVDGLHLRLVRPPLP